LSNVVQIAPEATAGIRAARDALEQQAARLGAAGDPSSVVLSAYAAAVGAQHRLIVDANLKSAALHDGMAKLIQEGRKPWSRDEMRTLTEQIDETLLHRWSQFNRGGIAIGVGVALAFGATCAGAGWWWRGYVPTTAGISAGAENCKYNPDGSVICWIPVWQVAPPVSARH